MFPNHSLMLIPKSLNQVYWSFGDLQDCSWPPKKVLNERKQISTLASERSTQGTHLKNRPENPMAADWDTGSDWEAAAVEAGVNRVEVTVAIRVAFMPIVVI